MKLDHTRKEIQVVKPSVGSPNQAQEESIEILKLSKDQLTFGNLEATLEKLYKVKEDDHYTGNEIVGQIGAKNYHKINIKKVPPPETRIMILQGLKSFNHIKNLSSLFSKIQKDHKRIRDYHCYFSDNMYQYMNLEQLESVSNAIGTYESFEVHKRRFEIIFFDFYNPIEYTEDERELFGLFKTFKEEVDNKKSGFTKRSFLGSVGNLIGGYWDPHLGALSRVLTKCLLLNTLRRGCISEEYFLFFLKKPVDSPYIYGLEEKYSKNYKGFSACNMAWHSFVHNYSKKQSCNDLAQECLNILVKNPEDIKKYSSIFTKNHLEKIYYKNMAKKGSSSHLHVLKDLLGDSEYATFMNSKACEITDKNLSYFGNQPIELKVKLKNIKNLEIRAYSFDVARYLKEFKSDPPFDVDLDGLIAKNVQKHTFDLPSQVEHVNIFSFAELDKYDRGFFIIDIVGDSMMSRAIVRKGTLSLVQLPYQYGYKLYILDEHKDICKGAKTGIYVEDRLMQVNEEGCVLVPFEKEEKKYDCILVHKNFGMKASYTVHREDIRLQGALIFNEESFISGRMAKMIMRIRLTLNKVPLSLKKLKDSVITLNTLTIDGVSNTKIFEDLDLSDGQDPFIEFLVPNGLNYIALTFEGNLETVNNPKLELSFTETVNIDKRVNTDTFHQPFLVQTPDSKDKNKTQYQIELRGRNGEPIMQERLYLHMSRTTDFKVQNLTVDTDKNGVVVLGDLENIESLQLKGKFGEQVWKVSNFYTSSLNLKNDAFRICEGEDLVLPSLSQKVDKTLPVSYELLRLDMSNQYLLDCSKKVIAEGQKIVIQGLKKGNYRLTYFLRDTLLNIRIMVLEAKRWKHSNLMIEHAFHLDHVTGELNFLNIDAVEQKGDHLEIQTTSNDASNVTVHIMGHLNTPVTIGYMEEQLRATRSQATTTKYELNKVNNQFVNGRVLGDEMKYVFDRQNKPAKIGNTLEKPSLLLHRKFIRETVDNEEVLNDGDNFDESKIETGVKTQKMKDIESRISKI